MCVILSVLKDHGNCCSKGCSTAPTLTDYNPSNHDLTRYVPIKIQEESFCQGAIRVLRFVDKKLFVMSKQLWDLPIGRGFLQIVFS